jgi:integrase
MKSRLPPRLKKRTRTGKKGQVWTYYFYAATVNGKTKEIPLGSDLNQAKLKWAELEGGEPPKDIRLFGAILDRYEKDIIPTKAPRTQKDNLSYAAWLRKVFEQVAIDDITPQMIAQYRDLRGKKAPVRANREISLLSHVWNMAREWGYTAKENPVKGVRKNKETPRDFYADDAVWFAVYECACQELRDALDLAYLTGQRPADVMKMKFNDIRDGALEIRQNKTQKKLRILLASDDNLNALGQLVERIRSRPTKIKSFSIIHNAEGYPLSPAMLRGRFDKARKQAAQYALSEGNAQLALKIKEFQFRDARPKAASEIDLDAASKLLGHSDKSLTERVYRRIGNTVKPVK